MYFNIIDSPIIHFSFPFSPEFRIAIPLLQTCSPYVCIWLCFVLCNIYILHLPSMYERKHVDFTWYNSLKMMFSNCIHLSSNQHLVFSCETSKHFLSLHYQKDIYFWLVNIAVHHYTHAIALIIFKWLHTRVSKALSHLDIPYIFILAFHRPSLPTILMRFS
jgi:hypothetical protein